MKVLGITALGHDASIALVENEKILFASQSERYSKIKNDYLLNQEILDASLEYGVPDIISFYENPWLKKLRQIKAGQYSEVFQIENVFKNYFKKFNFPETKIIYQNHHKTHAATGFYTSPFEEAVILCIDAIGEIDTITIWKGTKSSGLELKERVKYPHSIGLLYSAFTKLVGLKPNEEEYILMGMAAYGEPKYYKTIKNDFIIGYKDFKLRLNPHRGIPDWYLKDANIFDIAASIQKLVEEYIYFYIERCSKYSKNLVYVGGVALNCLANRNLYKYFDDIWIPVSPGDSGSSIGAAALVTNKLIWETPYLGYNINNPYPIKKALNALLKNKIIGIANGRAEFGPRALGNRSILADPRGPEIKDRVNNIKKRQKFRPFSPVILAEEAHKYFKIKNYSPYMQYVFECKFPDKYPAIVHKDGTSRVQMLSKTENPGLRTLLELFFKETGCPMLLNTSLNIKGQPIVNDIKDAKKFEEKYNISVFN